MNELFDFKTSEKVTESPKVIGGMSKLKFHLQFYTGDMNELNLF